MSSTDEVASYLQEHHTEHADLALWVRSLLLEAEPDFEQRIYRGWEAVGFHHPDAGYVCGLFPRPDGLQLLLEHGAVLPDPEGVLRGDGRQVRTLPVPDRSARTEEYIQRFLDLAVLDGLERKSTRTRN